MGKKETTIGFRVDDDLLEILQQLAAEEDRPMAAMARRLVVEALRQRGLITEKTSR
ncbi:MAG: ribbon-helix-helix protein, CopG family [Lentisphaerae bacterium]|nr:ribbon-helix-helix protein, CopG family [Lentisphaerota bacterium]